jgi:hypothetical protein
MLKNTKANQDSINKINNAIRIIKETAPQEIKRGNQKRRKWLDGSFETLRCHCYKLGIELPNRRTFYTPEHDLSIAEWLDDQMKSIILV